MASQGRLLVPKAMRMVRFAWDKASRAIRDKIPQGLKVAEGETQHVYVRASIKQPINRLAAIRQSQSRWYSTKQAITNTVRHFSSNSSASTPASRAAYPTSRTATAVSRLTSRAPFASTLRPNLTGGTLSRTAGGYGMGGGRVDGARYFSHSPATPAQVVQNVSQAVRAFWLSGSKARFDGMNSRTGEKRFREVSELQDKTYQKLDLSASSVKGSFIDFKVTPTITAIGPLSNLPKPQTSSDCDETTTGTLNDTILMSNLSIDFARALKDLAAIMNDLKRLSTLGELPVQLYNSTTLRVKFPGCDADTVESLCRELNIRRGIVGQDEGFDAKNGTEMALLFPFAPSKAPSEVQLNLEHNGRPHKKSKRDHVEWHEMLSRTESPKHSIRSVTSHDQDYETVDEMEENPWISSPSGYSSLHASELHDDDVSAYFEPRYKDVKPRHAPEYEGVEGIYRFLEQCDRAVR